MPIVQVEELPATHEVRITNADGQIRTFSEEQLRQMYQIGLA